MYAYQFWKSFFQFWNEANAFEVTHSQGKRCDISQRPETTKKKFH